MMFRFASRQIASPSGRRRLATITGDIARPVRKQVSLEERATLRAARKKLANDQQGSTTSQGSGTTSPVTGARVFAANSRYVWYLSVIVPVGLFTWAYNDENSPPAKISKWCGLTGLISGYAAEINKPSHEKLLPDWSQMPNVPHDIPVPHTLVLDLENTLVSSTWDRKYGWRHAKRPGVDKFLATMAQYYEIVLYSPSIDAIADPVVTSLDKTGCIMHRLYRDAIHFKNGAYAKDLDRLNRNVNRMILIDDDPDAAMFNPDNLIRIKPYEDPTDRTDNTLERITPFLVEIARKGYSDVPAILRQYRGMDADQIADEYQRRIDDLRNNRLHHPSMLGGLANRGHDLPPPELTPTMDDGLYSGTPHQLTAKDLVGAAPEQEGQGGMLKWMNRRAKEKEEQTMRKMEKWNEVMLKKQQARREAAATREN